MTGSVCPVVGWTVPMFGLALLGSPEISVFYFHVNQLTDTNNICTETLVPPISLVQLKNDLNKHLQ